MTREEFVRRWNVTPSVGFSSFGADLNALLDAERASAREEQREVDLQAAYVTSRKAVRAASLTATPLADRIAELERECDTLANRVTEVESERDEWKRAEEDARCHKPSHAS